MARLPQISITPVQYNPYVFEPQKVQGLKFDGPNVGALMENAFTKEENRRLDRDNQLKAFDDTLTEMKEALGSDEDKLWFDNEFAPKYREEINKYIRSNDVGGALKAVKDVAGKIKQDNEYVFRRDSWKGFGDTLAAYKRNPKLDKRDIRRFEEWNRSRYQFKGEYDENGNLTGYKRFSPDKLFNPYTNGQVVERFNFEDAFETAVKAVAERGDANATGTESKTGSSYTNAFRGGTSSSKASGSTHSKQTEYKLASEIHDYFMTLAKDPDQRQKLGALIYGEYNDYLEKLQTLEQAKLENDVVAISTLEDDLNTNYEVFTNTAGMPTIDSYLEKRLGKRPELAAYYRTSTKNTTSYANETGTVENPDKSLTSGNGNGSNSDAVSGMFGFLDGVLGDSGDTSIPTQVTYTRNSDGSVTVKAGKGGWASSTGQQYIDAASNLIK